MFPDIGNMEHPCARSFEVDMKEDFRGYNVTAPVRITHTHIQTHTKLFTLSNNSREKQPHHRFYLATSRTNVDARSLSPHPTGRISKTATTPVPSLAPFSCVVESQTRFLCDANRNWNTRVHFVCAHLHGLLEPQNTRCVEGIRTLLVF